MMKNHKDAQWVFIKDIEGKDVVPGMVRKVLAYCDAMMCVANDLAAGTVLPMHSHPHTQIVYIAEGRFRFTVGDEEKEVAKGDSICLQNGVRHGCTCLETGVAVDIFNPMREDFVQE
jgi:quercetin dioxygenase-like cupin family protein